MNLTFKKSIIATILCAALTAPVLVSASTFVENKNGPDSMTVPFADLNLNQSALDVALYRRLRSASDRACHSEFKKPTETASRGGPKCVNESPNKPFDATAIKNDIGMISSINNN